MFGTTFFRCCLVLGAFSAVTVPAWGYPDRERSDSGELSRREQMQQEAQASSVEIEALLKTILESVNRNERPASSVIEEAAAMLEEHKRFAIAYDDPQKASYMLLQAWTEFYADRLPGALNWSMRACKMDEASQDAWISQALFSMLSGKRPIEPKVPQAESPAERGMDAGRRPQPRPRPRANNQANLTPPVVPYSRKGTLDFDMLSLRGEILRERFGRMKYQTADGKPVEYKPGENTLCIFFWQIEPSAADANDIAGGGVVNPAAARYAGDFGISSKTGLADQRGYIGRIAKSLQEHPEITCFAVNTNALTDAQRAGGAIDEAFVREMGVPMVFAADPASGAGQFVGVKALTPFVLIADKTGVVRYAGPAADFMPAFVLTHLTGVEISLAGASSSSPVYEPDRSPGLRDVSYELRDQGPRSRMPEPTPQLPQPARPVADPNRPAPADPNGVSAASGTPEMSLQDQVTAEKLLAGATIEIEASRDIRGKSPAKGVTACKTVLEKYPGTVYAEQARELLRRVPERYWETYKIHDILGY